jgi:hypothetical protein
MELFYLEPTMVAGESTFENVVPLSDFVLVGTYEVLESARGSRFETDI